MNRKLAIYVAPGYNLARYEYTKLIDWLLDADIHINYFSSWKSPSLFEIETDNVRILIMTLNRFEIKGYHPDEIFGWYTEDHLLRRKSPLRPPYEGELFEYIKEIENGTESSS